MKTTTHPITLPLMVGAIVSLVSATAFAGETNAVMKRSCKPPACVKSTQKPFGAAASGTQVAQEEGSGRRSRGAHDRYANQEVSHAKGGGEVAMEELHIVKP